MPCQAKTEVLQFLHLQTVQQIRDAEAVLYSMGYRGTFSTTGDTARLDASMPDGVAVSVGAGDVILYRTQPELQVVSCKSWDEFNATFDIIP